jgi:hypothetical protein
VICDPRFHGRRNPERSVKLAEVVKAEMEGNRRFVVVEFFAEPIR